MPKPNLSICILALNEEQRIQNLLESLKPLSAAEIVVGVDDLTTDNTLNVAKKYTKSVFNLSHDDNFHANKQIVLTKASHEWILWMDADEEITPESCKEILNVIANPQADGYYLPRKNIIFNTWIEHTGWYPDYQLRLFRKNITHFPAKSVHEHPSIEGSTDYLTEPLLHYNYQTTSQFIEKLNRYTTNDALRLQTEHPKVTYTHIISKPVNEFVKRFIAWEGYKDGLHGLVLSLFQAFYELVVVAKIWEYQKFTPQNPHHFVEAVENEAQENLRVWRWWKREVFIQKATTTSKKFWHKGLRKLGL